jgi:pseudouridine-5'-phosphate glycosidase
MSEAELSAMLGGGPVEKANTANLGAAVFRGLWAATTVATTMELAAAAGVRVFATGGIGGVHRGYGEHLDISSDLAAFTRFPVAVVTSGVKSLLDVRATREALETLGVPVVGYRTDRFPAFYLRDGGCGVDARFDDAAELARFAASEMARTGRGLVIAYPIPAEAELDPEAWRGWLAEAAARAEAEGVTGRAVTPRVLALLNEVSSGATLAANLALVRSDAALAGRLAAAMVGSRT